MEKKLYIKEPGSAITHFIGMIMAIIAAIPLLYRAARTEQTLYCIAYNLRSQPYLALCGKYNISYI